MCLAEALEAFPVSASPGSGPEQNGELKPNYLLGNGGNLTCSQLAGSKSIPRLGAAMPWPTDGPGEIAALATSFGN